MGRGQHGPRSPGAEINVSPDLDSQTRSKPETESDSISEPGSEPHSSTKRPRMESSEADETNKQGLCVVC